MIKKVAALLLSILIAVPLFSQVSIFADDNKAYSEDEFASAVAAASSDAFWQVTGYETSADGSSVTVTLSIQMKEDKKTDQPVNLSLYILANQKVSMDSSAKVVSADITTKKLTNRTLKDLDCKVYTKDLDVNPSSTYSWLEGTSISSQMYGYYIIATSTDTDFTSTEYGRWIVTLNIKDISGSLSLRGGVPIINRELPGTFAFVGYSNSITGYTFASGNRWIDFTGSAPVQKTYAVSFNSNGGSSISTLSVQQGGSTILPTPSKSGSTFNGWYSDAALANKVASPYTPTSDVTLYAGWTENTPVVENWTISFNSKGGSAVNPISVTKGQSASLPTPTMSGYTFKGWYTDSALQNKAASPYTPTSDITLYAGWTENAPASDKWTVSFNSNGGSAVSSVSVTKGQSVSLPIPSLLGASFDGWFTDGTLRNRVTSPYTPSSDITLYAGWTISNQNAANKWTVTFNSNGGSSINSISVTKGVSVSLPTPSLNAYTFNGWYTESTLLNRVSSPYTPSSDITLYAGWTKISTDSSIGLRPNGGLTSSDNKTDSSTSSSSSGSNTSSNTNSGSDSASDSNSDSSNANDNNNANTNSNTLNINYNNGESNDGAAQTTYTVSYNTNGGNEISSSVVYAGNSVTLPTPTKSGYTFAGWYTDPDLNTKIGASTYTPSSNITLNAKWTANVSTDNTGAANSVPKTGVENNTPIVIFVMVALIASAAVIVFIRYRKISKNK